MEVPSCTLQVEIDSNNQSQLIATTHSPHGRHATDISDCCYHRWRGLILSHDDGTAAVVSSKSQPKERHKKKGNEAVKLRI